MGVHLHAVWHTVCSEATLPLLLLLCMSRALRAYVGGFSPAWRRHYCIIEIHYVVLSLSYHIISYDIISYNIISYHIISYHFISYHIILSFHIIISYYHFIIISLSFHYHFIIISLSFHIISYHIIWYYFISYHIISFRIISYLKCKICISSKKQMVEDT